MYKFPPDFEMKDTDPNIAVMLRYPDWSTGKVELVNSGDEILLLDGDDNRVDVLTWGDSDWDFAFDPAPIRRRWRIAGTFSDLHRFRFCGRLGDR